LIFRELDLSKDASVEIEPNLKKLKILETANDEDEDEEFDAGRLKIERLGSVLRQSQDRVSHILVESSGK
jgi:hypothetical protein